MGSVLGIIACILGSAFFSGSEIAFASAKPHRLRNKAAQGDKRAQLAQNMTENFEEVLSAILMGNNFVNIAATSISTVLIIDLVGGSRATALATLIMTIIILIFGEIIPKIAAKDNADKYVLFAAKPLRVVMIILQPMIKLVMFTMAQIHKIWPAPSDDMAVSAERLSSIIETIEDEGIIDEDASNLMQSALDFPDISVGEIVTPRVDVFAVDIEDDMPEILDQILDSSFSRIPVYEGSLDKIIGILHLPSFLRVWADQRDMSKEDFRALLAEDIAIPETMRLPKVFKRLNQGDGQMAIVIDEYGGTVGIVTLEDLLEELVGDIWDEYDEIGEAEIVDLGNGLYDVSATTGLRDFADELDLDFEELDSDYNTVGGLVLEAFGRFPEVGESVDFADLTFTVTQADATKINRLQVRVKTPEEDAL